MCCLSSEKVQWNFGKKQEKKDLNWDQKQSYVISLVCSVKKK